MTCETRAFSWLRLTVFYSGCWLCGDKLLGHNVPAFLCHACYRSAPAVPFCRCPSASADLPASRYTPCAVLLLSIGFSHAGVLDLASSISIAPGFPCTCTTAPVPSQLRRHPGDFFSHGATSTIHRTNGGCFCHIRKDITELVSPFSLTLPFFSSSGVSGFGVKVQRDGDA